MAPPKKQQTLAGSVLTPSERLDAIGIDAICDAVLDEKMLTDVATECGVTRSALLSWIAADNIRSARMRETRTHAAQIYEESALKGIEDAADPFELARAKEVAHHKRWRAAKISPIYADKVAVGGDPTGSPVRHALEMSDEALLAIAMQAKPQ